MQADQGRKAEAERRTALTGMRAALPLETAANQQRQQQLQQVQERVAKLRVSECRLLGAGWEGRRGKQRDIEGLAGLPPPCTEGCPAGWLAGWLSSPSAH